MHKLEFGRLAGMLDRDCSGASRDTPSLMGRQHQPTHFIDGLLSPGLPPVADTARTLAIRAQDDLEHTVSIRLVQTEITLVAPENLFLTLRAAKVLHHTGIA